MKTQKSPRSTTSKASNGFTAGEGAAMNERIQEQKAAARRGPADRADEEGAVLEKQAAS